MTNRPGSQVAWARHSRRNLTDAERAFWRRVRYRQLGGFRFRRQAPIGTYIVDFVCFERRLVIEVDGGQHMQAAEADRKRSDWLERNGFRVLRFWNHHVLQAPDAVIEAVWEALEQPAPHLNPPPRGGRKRSLPPSGCP